VHRSAKIAPYKYSSVTATVRITIVEQTYDVYSLRLRHSVL
jgi:hypothetical protein